MYVFVTLTLVLLSPFFCSTQKFGFICFTLAPGISSLTPAFFALTGHP